MCHGEENGCCLHRLSVETGLEKGHRSVALSRSDGGRGPQREPGQPRVEAPPGERWEAAAVLNMGNPLGFWTLGDL